MALAPLFGVWQLSYQLAPAPCQGAVLVRSYVAWLCLLGQRGISCKQWSW